ncbi:MAG: hypothetical protein ACKO27_08175, partial [Ilumatobacteraceae bacterium]
VEGEEDEFEDAPADAAAEGARRRAAAEDEDDDEMLSADDVEEDLDTILKATMAGADEDYVDEEEEGPEVQGDQGDKLQPKRADERLCSSCFLLVRQAAPSCPVGDDDCPLFS